MSTVVGIVLVGGITVAMVFGFGVRECKSGFYKDAANCIKCSDKMQYCSICDKGTHCTQCIQDYQFDSASHKCKNCSTALGPNCLDCSSVSTCT